MTAAPAWAKAGQLVICRVDRWLDLDVMDTAALSQFFPRKGRVYRIAFATRLPNGVQSQWFITLEETGRRAFAVENFEPVKPRDVGLFWLLLRTAHIDITQADTFIKGKIA